MRIILPYPPSANRYWRISRNRLYLSKHATAFKFEAAVIARNAGMIPLSCPMEVLVTLHPKTTKKGIASRVIIDLDNALKVTIDALNGIAWVDDAQVVSIHARMGSAVDGGAVAVEAHQDGMRAYAW